MEREDVAAFLPVAARVRREVLEPAERLLDALADPAAVSTHAAFADAASRAREVGLGRMTLPERDGGLGAPVAAGLLTAAEVADGAPGFAAQLLGEEVGAGLAGGAGRCLVVVQEGMEPSPLPGSRLAWRSARVREPAARLGSVERSGGMVRLRGVTVPAVAGAGSCARIVVLLARGADVESHVVDRAAVSVGPRRALTGLRVQSRADVTFEDVALGAGTLVLPGREGAWLLERALVAACLVTTAIGLGIARRAHREALAYCRTRVQGGRPIIEHQSVAGALWRAASATAVAGLALEQSLATPEDDLPALRAALALRSATADLVPRVTVDMLELLGGYGVTTDYPMEKLFRDGRALLSTTGFVEGEGVDVPVGWL